MLYPGSYLKIGTGNPFFLPHGTRIFTKLQNFIREEYRKRGYQEVITPLIFNTDLWKKSGHYANYKDDMFTVTGCRYKFIFLSFFNRKI